MGQRPRSGSPSSGLASQRTQLCSEKGAPRPQSKDDTRGSSLPRSSSRQPGAPLAQGELRGCAGGLTGMQGGYRLLNKPGGQEGGPVPAVPCL